MPDDIFEKYQKRVPLSETGPEKIEEKRESREPAEVQSKKTEIEELASLEAKIKESPPLPLKKRTDLTQQQREAADAIVQKLVALAGIKGEQVAVAEAAQMDQYIQDRLHDQLVEERNKSTG